MVSKNITDTQASEVEVTLESLHKAALNDESG
jgi:hypothetical protein